jgi:hypothetical protein
VHVSHYYLLGFFSGTSDAPDPNDGPAAGGGGGGNGQTGPNARARAAMEARQIETGNAAAIQFMFLAALALEELR